MATTVDYLNKLILQKNTLADNLITKGITASYDETLETLVPKVLNISDGGGDGNTVLSFKNENLLLTATPYTSSNIEILQTDSKVTITVPDGSSPQWFKLFNDIDFKINTFYKISVNTFGYGRIGISNSSSNPHNNSRGVNTNACVFSNAISKEGEIKGDNYLIDSENYSARFIINLYSGSNTSITQSGSIWFCNDLALNNKREGFSFEISILILSRAVSIFFALVPQSTRIFVLFD